MSWRVTILAGFVGGLAAACSSGVAPRSTEQTEEPAEIELPIINGAIDTTHQAVVYVDAIPSFCTGTIIHVSGNYAYVLTAAHCMGFVTPTRVIQDDDVACASEQPPTCDAIYPVEDALANPYYNGQANDFAMLKVSGATPSTPVIPAMSPAQDNLSVGSQVDNVGYGLVTYPFGQTTERHHLAATLDMASVLLLRYSQTTGGPCAGDSGGPTLSTGVERVAGVISSGDTGCEVYGLSGRVSAVYDSFI